MRRTVSFAVLVLGTVLSSQAEAQSTRVYRVGLLDTTSATANRANLDSLLRGLRDAGYVEGKNLVIDYRSAAEGRGDRFADLARDLVRAKPDVILTRGTPAAIAARDAGSVPVVMVAVADPVASNIVASLSRPGGHVTGLTTIVNELQGKRLELMKDLLPSVKKVGYLVNPNNPNSPRQGKEVEARARSLGLEARGFEAFSAETLERALKAAVANRVDVLVLAAEGVVVANQKMIIDFAARNRLPVMYSERQSVVAGGLVSYGVHYSDYYYRAASYVDKVLKGATVGDLPIEQPTRLELVINLRAAKALGLNIPAKVLARADEVIR
jgi:putative ABC transport system substrate-binding protein